jgi:hypothetical protein
MTKTIEPGGTDVFAVTYYAYPGGPPVDCIAGPTVSINLAGATAGTVEHLSTGLYAVIVGLDALSAPGGYVLTWTGTIPSTGVVVGYETFTVPALPDQAWATVADVLDVTGATVTELVLGQAQAAIDVFSGRSVAIRSRLRPRDLHWLRLAVAYQAAWLSGQPDPFTRSDITTLAQDGASVAFGPAGLVLAPLARRALNRCRWRGSRSVTVSSPSDYASIPAALALDPAYDDMLPWASF